MAKRKSEFDHQILMPYKTGLDASKGRAMKYKINVILII